MKQVFFVMMVFLTGPVAAQQQAPKKIIVKKNATCTPANGKPCCNMPTKRPVAKPVQKPAATKKS